MQLVTGEELVILKGSLIKTIFARPLCIGTRLSLSCRVLTPMWIRLFVHASIHNGMALVAIQRLFKLLKSSKGTHNSPILASHLPLERIVTFFSFNGNIQTPPNVPWFLLADADKCGLQTDKANNVRQIFDLSNNRMHILNRFWLGVNYRSRLTNQYDTPALQTPNKPSPGFFVCYTIR
ncbi:hypothetical protein ACFE04_013800 [Oxalis oulophora]